jgi:TetR/AcrR family transcriptional regulator, regulator of autoinduction and epiphytic fitness
VRQYISPLRADQARDTQRAIIDAATALFSEKGFAGVSIDAIAAATGVSRATVFSSVGGKPAILGASFRAAFGAVAGDADTPMPFIDRPRSRTVRSIPSARDYLAGYAGLVTPIFSRMSGVYEAIREGSRSDPEVGALWKEINEERRRGAATIVADVKARAKLRRGLRAESAADVVWVLNDPGIFHVLVHGRDWSMDQYAVWLARMIETELIG